METAALPRDEAASVLNRERYSQASSVPGRHRHPGVQIGGVAQGSYTLPQRLSHRFFRYRSVLLADQLRVGHELERIEVLCRAPQPIGAALGPSPRPPQLALKEERPLQRLGPEERLQTYRQSCLTPPRGPSKILF